MSNSAWHSVAQPTRQRCDQSESSKIHGREPMRMNPLDAEQRGIRDGDVVRVFNDRGAFLAGVRLSAALRRGVRADRDGGVVRRP